MRTTAIILLLLILLFSGCKKIEELSRFEMEYNNSLVIPSLIGINLPFNIPLQEIPVDVESQFALHDVRRYFVEEACLDTLTVSIDSPSYAEFNFLRSVYVYVSAEGLSEMLVAWKEDIPDNDLRSLSLEVAGDDLSEYIKKKRFSLRVHAVIDELIVTDHNIGMHSVFSIDARIMGQ